MSTVQDDTSPTAAELLSLFHKGSVPKAITVDGRFVEVNAAFLELFGFVREDMLGRSAVELGIIDEAASARRIAEIRASGGAIRDREIVVRAKNGERRDVSHWAIETQYRGQPARFSELLDVTERSRMERELRDTQRQQLAQADELRRANADLEQFAYAASHDLQEPLRAIAGYVQLIGDKVADALDDDGRLYIERTVLAVERLKRLISDLLSLSRSGRGEPTPVSARLAAEEAIGNLDAAIAECGAQVHMEAPETWPIVVANYAQLVSVLQNLIGNAVKFRRPSSAPTVTISVDCATEAEATFTVEDDGLGVSPEFAAKLFVIFQRLHGRAFAGSGIGLAVAKRAIERMDGRIWHEPAASGGSRFRFTLKVAL